MVVLLKHGWGRQLSDLVASAQRRLVIAAPYMSAAGVDQVTRNLAQGLRERGRLEIMTDLSPDHVLNGSLDPHAIVGMRRSADHFALWHIPRLHAKVYVADDSAAIITSGNLTGSAFFRNAEYGVLIKQSDLVRSVVRDFEDFQATGVPVSSDDLEHYAVLAAEVRDASRRRDKGDPELKRALDEVVRSAEDELIRLRLREGAVHTVFAKTVRFLLSKHGPMATPEIHEWVRRLHPDLCDDSIDRVIDGKRFGKKWKHAVRTAQQQLKREGVATLHGDQWSLLGGGSVQGRSDQ